MWITIFQITKTHQYIQMKIKTTVELQNNSSYSSELSLNIKNSNLLKLQLIDGTSRELSQPIVGRTFVSGLLEDGKTIGHFRRSYLRTIEFASSESPKLQALRYTRQTIGELLLDNSFPREVRYRFREEQGSFQKCRALGVVRGFLVTDLFLNPAIPLDALSVIEVGCE